MLILFYAGYKDSDIILYTNSLPGAYIVFPAY